MIDTRTPEYRAIELDSSNELMAYDSRWVLGRYPQAASHALRAGIGRRQMGKWMFDAGDFEHAAEDWLSAAECFYLATDLDRMRACIGLVRDLADRGLIPSERVDLYDAIPEREGQARDLEARLAAFRRDYPVTVGTGADRLDWLQRQVKLLPGFPNLHAALTVEALRLGRFSLAAEYLDWAEAFPPGNIDPRALRMRLLVEIGDTEGAVRLGREILAARPDSAHVRVLLAFVVAFPVGKLPLRSDWAEAAELLGPLTDSPATGADGLIPLVLAITLRHGLGDETEYRRLLAAFDSVTARYHNPVAEQLRRTMPEIFPTHATVQVPAQSGRVFPPLPMTRYKPLQEVVAQAAA